MKPDISEDTKEEVACVLAICVDWTLKGSQRVSRCGTPASPFLPRGLLEQVREVWLTACLLVLSPPTGTRVSPLLPGDRVP